MPALWWADWRDGRTGQLGRRAARWGYVRPPQAGGRILWLVAGAHYDSVRLGAELLRGLREKRRDVRLVLTFEAEYPELLAPLEGLPKTGWGFGACDHRRAVDRIVTRLDPYGVIYCGVVPRLHLARRLAHLPRQLVIAAGRPPYPMRVERVYPRDPEAAASWGDAPCAPCADLLTLVTVAQVDPSFRALVNGERERHLWWLHSDRAPMARDFIACWQAHLGADILFVSGAAAKEATLCISAWKRTPLPDGCVVAVDAPQWLPAVAASVVAAHLVRPSASVRWQALAGGAALSSADADWAQAGADAIEFRTEAAEVVADWRALIADPIRARRRGDAARRMFWAARRAAAAVHDDLLRRVFEW